MIFNSMNLNQLFLFLNSLFFNNFNLLNFQCNIDLITKNKKVLFVHVMYLHAL